MSEHIVGVNPKEYNGRKYRSTLEANTAKLLDEMGLPWEYETKKITLQDGFYCSWQKRKVESIDYIPDFILGPVMVEMKGYETPDWKIKKKLLYKYFKQNEPDAIYYICKNHKQLLEALDHHWPALAFAIQVTPSPKVKSAQDGLPILFPSIKSAMQELGLKGKSIIPIIRSLTGKKEFVYNYNWKLVKITL